MNNKGVVLLIALWILLFLSLIAWGLSRRSTMEVSLLETYRGKLRSYAAARAGLNTILDLMQSSPSGKDTLMATGITVDPTKGLESVFSHIKTDQNAYAIVQWQARNFVTNDTPQLEYGLRDEGGRININAINATNFQILSALLQIQGLSQSDGDKLAMAIVNYSASNAQLSGNNSFIDISDNTLKPKAKPYENILELLEVNGMTKDIFDKIKDDITVFGNTQTGLWINADTANNDVIQAVANAAVRLNPSADAATIVQEAYTIRDGDDGQSFTADDGVTSVSTITDPNWPSTVLQEGASNYYRIRVVGVDSDSNTRTVLEVVVHFVQGSNAEIVSWQRD